MRIFLRAGKMPTEVIDPFTTIRRNVTGTNIGNMLFQQSVAKSLSLPDYDVRAYGLDLRPSLVDWINDECDMLVLPFANQFRPEFSDRLDIMATTIRKLKVPVTVVSIGCQTNAEYDYSNLNSIKVSAKRFISAVLDKSAVIGVRGDCTAGYVRSLGFRDVEVIGCPSMFMNGATLASPRAIRDFDGDTRISTNISAVGGQAAFSTGFDRMGESISLANARYRDVDYIPQENRSILDLLLAKDSEQTEHHAMRAETYEALHKRGNVTSFVDPRTWFEHLATRQFVYGTRLHGNIAGLLSGTPAHLLAHDSRTVELADYHHIPYTRMDAFSEKEDPRELYERSDYTEMTSNHRDRFETYAGFLRKNGLKNVFSDGDSGSQFEQQLQSAALPEAIRSISPDNEIRKRLIWGAQSSAAQSRDVEAARKASTLSAQGYRAMLKLRRSTASILKRQSRSVHKIVR